MASILRQWVHTAHEAYQQCLDCHHQDIKQTSPTMEASGQTSPTMETLGQTFPTMEASGQMSLLSECPG